MNHPDRSHSRPAPRRRLLAGLAATALCAGLGITNLPAAHAADSPNFCSDGSLQYVPVSTVETYSPGQAVKGLSVTSGSAPVGFTGSYVGFVDNALGKDKDLLLFRLSSDVIDGTEATGGLKGAGIWAGMSGSPVYTPDGQLIGAVSYSLTWENLPIAGVTPAEYMKSIGSTAISTTAKVRLTSSNLKTAKASTKVAGTSLVGGTLTPVRTVNVAGKAGTKQNAFANRTMARTPRTAKASSFLRSGNLMAAAAVGSVQADLVDGGTVVALLGSGDVLSGAIGTVTAICTENGVTTVWAFGHALNNAGNVNMMMANASTALIVPDSAGLNGSYKQISEFGAPVGVFTQDRSVGSRGTITSEIKAIDVSVDVQNASGVHVITYDGRISDPEVAASGVAYLVGEAAMEQLDQYGAGTGEVTWTVNYQRADGTPGSLTNSQVVTDRYWFPDVIGTPPANDVWSITENEFEDVAITSVAVTLKLQSDKSISYKAAGVQLDTKGVWGSLSGKKLKAGSTYSLRPQYKVVTNGKAGATIPGGAVSVKLSSKARKSGSFAFASVNTPEEECYTLSDGSIVCEDWEESVAEEYADFDELIAALDEQQPDSSVLGILRYKLKKGSTGAEYTWTGPGVVTGRVSTTFSIKS